MEWTHILKGLITLAYVAVWTLERQLTCSLQSSQSTNSAVCRPNLVLSHRPSVTLAGWRHWVLISVTNCSSGQADLLTNKGNSMSGKSQWCSALGLLYIWTVSRNGLFCMSPTWREGLPLPSQISSEPSHLAGFLSKTMNKFNITVVVALSLCQGPRSESSNAAA